MDPFKNFKIHKIEVLKNSEKNTHTYMDVYYLSAKFHDMKYFYVSY